MGGHHHPAQRQHEPRQQQHCAPPWPQIAQGKGQRHGRVGMAGGKGTEVIAGLEKIKPVLPPQHQGIETGASEQEFEPVHEQARTGHAHEHETTGERQSPRAFFPMRIDKTAANDPPQTPTQQADGKRPARVPPQRDQRGKAIKEQGMAPKVPGQWDIDPQHAKRDHPSHQQPSGPAAPNRSRRRPPCAPNPKGHHGVSLTGN